MKFEFPTFYAEMIREAITSELAKYSKAAERSGCLAFRLEAKDWRELLETFDSQWED